ncbi:hypothetical protein GLOIN_2v1570762 [Rhizophagus clarus]|uniref:Uncharacterized protein n=1 Tax=Rhizophagus clarus TaxID=94130 RepID=A0A8H3QDD6_9GLOM|nr:hypothetical protein GLOIN_2v1570762 [Rhizophagus clarus]
MNIWKVKLDYDEINNFSTEDDIKNHGRGITGFDSLYYNNDNKKPEISYLHIFIIPTSTGFYDQPLIKQSLVTMYQEMVYKNVHYTSYGMRDKTLPADHYTYFFRKNFEKLKNNSKQSMIS